MQTPPYRPNIPTKGRIRHCGGFCAPPFDRGADTKHPSKSCLPPELESLQPASSEKRSKCLRPASFVRTATPPSHSIPCDHPQHSAYDRLREGGKTGKPLRTRPINQQTPPESTLNRPVHTLPKKQRLRPENTRLGTSPLF